MAFKFSVHFINILNPYIYVRGINRDPHSKVRHLSRCKKRHLKQHLGKEPNLKIELLTAKSEIDLKGYRSMCKH